MADPVRVEEAFPSVITRKQFEQVSKLLRSRAPKIVHPRRTASPFLLSGLVKCRTCKRALTGQYSKSPRYPYYVCQTLMKRGSGSCDAPRLNARRFEELIVERIRANFLAESCMPDLVKLVAEEMEGVTAEQRKRVSDHRGRDSRGGAATGPPLALHRNQRRRRRGRPVCPNKGAPGQATAS